MPRSPVLVRLLLLPAVARGLSPSCGDLPALSGASVTLSFKWEESAANGDCADSAGQTLSFHRGKATDITACLQEAEDCASGGGQVLGVAEMNGAMNCVVYVVGQMSAAACSAASWAYNAHAGVGVVVGHGTQQSRTCWVRRCAPTAAPAAPPAPPPSSPPVRPPTAAPATSAPTLSPAVAQPPTSAPTPAPTAGPAATPTAATAAPTAQPTAAPTAEPAATPTAAPPAAPTDGPAPQPTAAPTLPPTAAPVNVPTAPPTAAPVGAPTAAPAGTPTLPPASAPAPTARPSAQPTAAGAPTAAPTAPAGTPTAAPALPPARAPTASPSVQPTAGPAGKPTAGPAGTPTLPPVGTPPAGTPTLPPADAFAPTAGPSAQPTAAPTHPPARAPTASPSVQPTAAPAGAPTAAPTLPPARAPTASPSVQPTAAPAGAPTAAPSATPTLPPASAPAPTASPSVQPTAAPEGPSAAPSATPTAQPALKPTAVPTVAASAPTSPPVPSPTVQPAAASATAAPSAAPTAAVLSPEVQNPLRQQIDSTLTGVAVASMAVGPAPGLASLALLSKTCVEDSDVYGGLTHNELPIVLHPLRFRVAGDVYLGCVVAGFAVSAGACFLYVAVKAVCRPVVVRAGLDPVKLEADLLFPGVAVSLILFMYQGMTYATGHLILRGGPFKELVGTLSLAFVFGTPAVLWRWLLRPAGQRMVYEIDPQRGRVRDFILGPGEWCSLQRRWHERFAVAVWPYRRPTAGVFALVAKTAVLGLTSAAVKHNAKDCAMYHGVYAAAALTHTAVTLSMHCYARPRDTVWEAATGALTGGAMVARVVGYLSGDSLAAKTFAAASTMLLLATAALAIRVVLDVVSSVYTGGCRVCGRTVGRRERLQRRVTQSLELARLKDDGSSGAAVYYRRMSCTASSAGTEPTGHDWVLQVDPETDPGPASSVGRGLRAPPTPTLPQLPDDRSAQLSPCAEVSPPRRRSAVSLTPTLPQLGGRIRRPAPVAVSFAGPSPPTSPLSPVGDLLSPDRTGAPARARRSTVSFRDGTPQPRDPLSFGRSLTQLMPRQRRRSSGVWPRPMSSSAHLRRISATPLRRTSIVSPREAAGSHPNEPHTPPPPPRGASGSASAESPCAPSAGPR